MKRHYLIIFRGQKPKKMKSINQILLLKPVCHKSSGGLPTRYTRYVPRGPGVEGAPKLKNV